MSSVKRYDFVLCDCAEGPHVEREQTDDGEYVRWEAFDSERKRADEWEKDFNTLKAERDLLLAIRDALETDYEDDHIIDEGCDGWRVGCGSTYQKDCAVCAALDAYDTWKRSQGRDDA